MRLVFLTTTDKAAGREADFVRMLSCLRESAGTTPYQVFALLQRCSEREAARHEHLLPPGSCVIASPERMSLSAARNRLLESARPSLTQGNDIVVGFPDDDCWYPSGFLGELVSAFRQDESLDMLVCRVSLSPDDVRWASHALQPARAADCVRRTSSNSMFFRGSLVCALGPFDGGLGLGTPSGAGEDTDYALRGFLAARKAIHVPLPLVGHRESDLETVTRYFRGSLLVIGRYAARRPELAYEYGRKLCVGAYLTTSLRLPIKEYVGAVRRSLGEVVRSAAPQA